MKKIALVVVLLGSAVMTPTTVSAATLLDIVDAPKQLNTSYALTFTANAATSTISFAGYDLAAFFKVSAIGLFSNNSGTSIISPLGRRFTFTPAPSGSSAFAAGNELYFEGLTAGSYDTFAQVANTIAGSSYTLRFNLTNEFGNQGTGLHVEASNATIGAIPEPATWAMMLVGFALIGATVRYRRRHSTVRYA